MRSALSLTALLLLAAPAAGGTEWRRLTSVAGVELDYRYSYDGFKDAFQAFIDFRVHNTNSYPVRVWIKGSVRCASGTSYSVAFDEHDVGLLRPGATVGGFPSLYAEVCQWAERIDSVSAGLQVQAASGGESTTSKPAGTGSPSTSASSSPPSNPPNRPTEPARPSYTPPPPAPRSSPPKRSYEDQVRDFERRRAEANRSNEQRASDLAGAFAGMKGSANRGRGTTWLWQRSFGLAAGVLPIISNSSGDPEHGLEPDSDDGVAAGIGIHAETTFWPYYGPWLAAGVFAEAHLAGMVLPGGYTSLMGYAGGARLLAGDEGGFAGIFSLELGKHLGTLESSNGVTASISTGVLDAGYVQAIASLRACHGYRPPGELCRRGVEIGVGLERPGYADHNAWILRGSMWKRGSHSLALELFLAYPAGGERQHEDAGIGDGYGGMFTFSTNFDTYGEPY